jgi:uncharacterized protein
MTAQRITMITLSVADLAISRKYYSNLGWHEAEGGNKMIAFYKMAGQFMALYSRAALQRDLGQPVPDGSTGSITLAKNYTTALGVDEAHAAALAAGATEITAPQETDWGGYSGFVTDPDGHLWEHAYNPFWQLDEVGLITGDP